MAIAREPLTRGARDQISSVIRFGNFLLNTRGWCHMVGGFGWKCLEGLETSALIRLGLEDVLWFRTSTIVRLWADITAGLIKWLVVWYRIDVKTESHRGPVACNFQLRPDMSASGSEPEPLLDSGCIKRLHVGMWPDFPFVSRCLLNTWFLYPDDLPHFDR